MLFLPRCEDRVDGGQLDSASISVLKVLIMEEMAALSMSPFPCSHHIIFVFAQNCKGVIALDLLFFYQPTGEIHLTVSFLNVAFHTIPAFVGERA